MKRIPALGIVGVLALREAAASEYRQVTGLVRAALEATLAAAAASPSDLCCNVIIEAMYADRVIVCRRGRYWAYPYTIDESNQVQIGAKAEVKTTCRSPHCARRSMPAPCPTASSSRPPMMAKGAGV